MPTYYYELNGGRIQTTAKFSGGEVYVVPSGGGGGGTMQSKSVSYTPSETAISATVSPDYGYDGLSSVSVSVGAISSSYVGSDISRRDSTDLSVSGGTVTVPTGYYASSASKAVAPGSATTPATTITANPTITISGNSVSASVSKTQSITPTVSAGYVASGTAGTVTVSGSDSATIPNASAPYLSGASISNAGALTTDVEIDNGGYINSGTYEATLNGAFSVQAAQTITPTTSDQTIASGKYLTGAQTILGDADLVAGNIKKDVVIFGVTGTYEGGGGGTDYLAEMQNNTLTSYSSTAITSVLQYGFRGATALEDVTLPNLTTVNDYAFNGCTGLKTVSLPSCTLVRSHAFEGCNNSGFTTVVLPSCATLYSQSFQSCSNLEAVDILGGGNQIGQQSFRNDTPFNVLVIRASSVTPLQNVNVFDSTKFASNGTGGTLYVPNDVISSYQSASNWSTILGYANNQIKKIEGSYYETHYADGTAIS